MPVRALVAAGALFDLDENSVRVALARLFAARLVERDERGRYRLGDGAVGVRSHVAGWRSVEERVRSWSGDWIGVSMIGLGRSDRARLRRRDHALRFLGFRPLETGLAIRPDNLTGGISWMRERLRALGLEPAAMVFRIAALDLETEARARGLWDAKRLRADYREIRKRLEASEARLGRLAPAAAMKESFILGGRAIRQIVLDPLLPEPLVPAAERAALVLAMRRYDRIGRDVWSSFLEGFGVPHRHSPADLSRIAAFPEAAGGFV